MQILVIFSLRKIFKEKHFFYRASEPRTVVLHRGKKGFGFVLRGAKATSPLMERPHERGPALQYLDDVDPGGVADLSGLKIGDYLLKVRRNNSNSFRLF